MLKKGLIEETKSAIDQGWRDWAPLRSVGYKETVDFLDQKISREELGSEITLHTQQLAKKQRTWFKRDKEVKWFHPLQGKHNIFNEVKEFLNV